MYFKLQQTIFRNPSKARNMKRPSVEELGEANDKYIVGTAEILTHP